MNWPHLEIQWIREEYNRRKNRGKSPKRKVNGQMHGKNKEASALQEILGSKPTSIREGKMEGFSQSILGLNDR
jgi:hypothetical protein